MRSVRLVSFVAVSVLVLGACTNDFGQFSANGENGGGDAQTDGMSGDGTIDTGPAIDSSMPDVTMGDADAGTDSFMANESGPEAGDSSARDATDSAVEGGDGGEAGPDASDSGVG